MNATNRARVISALKTLAVLTFLSSPGEYLLRLDELDMDFGWIPFIAHLIEGALMAVVCLAGVIIIEAAHWYITDKEREAGIEDY